jgi:predicted TIM-barrel fold metal-dependent hydrolase
MADAEPGLIYVRERRLPYETFDADNHLYENQDALTKFLPKNYKDAIKYVDVDGRKKLAIRDHISQYIPNPTFERVAVPGGWGNTATNKGESGKSMRDGVKPKAMPGIDAFFDPEPRLALMKDMGIDRTVLWPTLASVLEERVADDPEFAVTVIHALNEWMHETWQFSYEDRIFATPVITMPVVDKAIEELEWVVERGAKVVLIRPAPVPGYRGPRSFALPEFDPFWEKVVEHDVLVALHSSDSGYERYANEWIGSDSEMLPFQPQAFRMLGAWRPVEDAVGSLVVHGALSRFPDLKVVVVENGSIWVEPLLRNLADIYKKMPQDFMEEPVAVFKRQIHISPFWEEDLGALAELIGEDRVLFGSDFPHPEGLADPATYVNELEGLSDETIRKIMGGNLARLMNVKDAVLR